ncbi:MAG TPA: type II toxin-antitoxin system HicB family antitoxin [Chloroflexota bacterium]|nr:type II toxin-antitoxin system HicB family antitoxin [Chloroflexota bacterium]
MKYAVVIEYTPNSFAAYVPDLPGCVATGATRTEVERNIREAIVFHLEGLREDGLPIPEPQTEAIVVEIDAVA